jgi:hypothetical protein
VGRAGPLTIHDFVEISLEETLIYPEAKRSFADELAARGKRVAA